MGKEYTRQTEVLGLIPFSDRILLLDTFTPPVKYTLSGSPGYTVKRTISKSIYSPHGLHLQTATDPLSTKSCKISYKTFIGLSSKTLFSTVFNPLIITYFTLITFSFLYDTSTTRYDIRIRYDPVNDKWQYWNSSGTWADIPSGSQILTNNTWNRLSFSFNIGTTKYIDFLSNHLHLDISSLSFETTAGSFSTCLTTEIEIENTANTIATLNLDNISLIEK